MLSGSEDKTVAMWDVATLSCISVFAGHDNIVPCVVGLPDGRLASGSSDVKIWDPVTAGSEEQSKQLTKEFNEANKTVKTISSASVWAKTQSELKSFVTTIFGSAQAKGSLDTGERAFGLYRGDVQTDSELSYPELSTKYPSTIGMYASTLARAAAAVHHKAEDDSRHATNLVNVLFASSHDTQQVAGPLDDSVLWNRIKDWRTQLRKRKGPKVVHWLGIFKAKQAQQLVTRLDELCRNSGVERVTYLSVKHT